MNKAVNFMIRFLEQLQTEDIVLAAIRPKALDENEAFKGDYDFLGDEKQLDKLLSKLFEMASAECINFTVNRTKLGKTKLYIYDPDDSRPVTLEIWNHLEVSDNHSLRYIFFEDIKPYIQKNSEGVYTFDQEVEALYYLIHLKTKKKELSKTEVKSRLRYYHSQLQKMQSSFLYLYSQLINDSKNIDEFVSVATQQLNEKQILFTVHNQSRLSRARQRQKRSRLHRLYGRWLRLLKVTPVIGPDGVGKTSIIETLKLESSSRVKYYRFKKLFRHNLLYQISRRFLSRRIPSELAKNQYDDIYGAWLMKIAWLRYPLLLFQSLVSGRYYFCDRYFHDLIFENVRFKDKVTQLRENWEQMLKKIPNTFWFLHLDAPTKVIHSRKQELSAQAIDSYRHNVFRLYLKKPSRVYSYVNTALPLEQCSKSLIHSALILGVKPK